jgi:threonine dehydrogenase-like Zn-dependent dehydrogenase
MRAVQFDGELRFETNYPDPQIKIDQALIRVRCAGICNTDLELIKRYMGFSGILGHEFVGEVILGSDALIGQRVVGEINVADGDCDFCERGIPSQCVDRVTVGIDRHDGAFADRLALTVRNLHIVPDNVSDTAAVFVEPLAAALQITEAVHISPRNRIIVIGAGKLGMLVSQILKLTGADIAVVVRREKQARLLQKWGIPAMERSELPDNSADVVVDCTGVSDGFADALNLVKPRGVIVLKSTYVNLPQADLTRVVVDEIRVIGSRCGPFDSALRLLSANLVDVESLVEARYSLDDAINAINHASKKGVLKILLDI